MSKKKRTPVVHVTFIWKANFGSQFSKKKKKTIKNANVYLVCFSRSPHVFTRKGIPPTALRDKPTNMHIIITPSHYSSSPCSHTVISLHIYSPSLWTDDSRGQAGSH